MPGLFSSFSGDTASASLSVLLILAKATLVLLAALGVTKLMERGSAIARHLVWFVSLGALLLIPVLASWSPIRLAILPSGAAPSDVGAPIRGVTTGVPTGLSPGAPTIALPAAVAPAQTPPATPATSTPESSVLSTVSAVRSIVSPSTSWFGILSNPRVLFAIWISVAVLFAGWLAFGALSVQRIINRSRVLDSADWTNPLWEVADRLELDRAPRLVRSDDAKMPFACGLMRPTIVL